MTYRGRLTTEILRRDFIDADWRNILNIAIKWGKGDEQFTQDLIQAAVVKVHEIGRGKVCALYTVAAKNAMRDLIRKEKRRERLEFAPGHNPDKMVTNRGESIFQHRPTGCAEGVSDDGACVDRIGDRLVIDQALSKLDDEERALVGAISVGLEVAEAADAFGWSVPKTKSKLHRIQSRMRNHFPS